MHNLLFVIISVLYALAVWQEKRYMKFFSLKSTPEGEKWLCKAKASPHTHVELILFRNTIIIIIIYVHDYSNNNVITGPAGKRKGKKSKKSEASAASSKTCAFCRSGFIMTVLCNYAIEIDPNLRQLKSTNTIFDAK